MKVYSVATGKTNLRWVWSMSYYDECFVGVKGLNMKASVKGGGKFHYTSSQ